MLFTEGYMWSEYQFGALSSAPVKKLEDLRGRRLAVEAASPLRRVGGSQRGTMGFHPPNLSVAGRYGWCGDET